MKYPLIPTLIASAFLPLASQAAIIATENFDYADGSIVGQAGGTGWSYERTDEVGAPAQSASDWDDVFGSHQVASSRLVTNNGGVKREFGGATEGVASPSNEREGAFRADGAMFFSTTITITAMLPVGQNQWAGVSTYDFGTERVFYGLPGQTTDTRFFGIGGGIGGDVLSTIPVLAGTTYTIVGMLDFDNDRVALWVNPDGSDNASSYDVSKTYTGTNWLTALRFASGTEAAWDNAVVGTTFGDVVPVPEPSVPLIALGAVGLFSFARRRR